MKIFGIHANYNKVKEKSLYNKEESTPIVFTMPDSAILKPGRPFFLPEHFGRITAEVGIVVKISKLGKCIEEKFAHRYYDCFTLGIDMTASDLLERLRFNKQAWDIAKGFDSSAVIGEWLPVEKVNDISRMSFSMKFNEIESQKASSSDMIYSIDKLIAYLSQYFTLKIGDMIFTGTPFASWEIKIGDRLQGKLEDNEILDLSIK